MIEQIIKEMALKVASVGFVSKSGGLMQEANTTAGNGDVIMTLAQVAPFASNALIDVSPDRNESAISFFRASPTRIVRQDTYLTLRENDLTFTCWINGNKTSEEPGTSAEEMIVQALRSYRVPIGEGGPIRMAEIEYLGDNTGEQINRWGWENKMLRYNEAPHRLFQHRFKITYAVATGCYSQTVHVLNPAC
jgi:hypothetical protein